MTNEQKKLVGVDAYPIFIMHEQLSIINGLLDYSRGLDAIWEECCIEYAKFRESEYDDINQSEFDCIVNYVNSKFNKH